MRTLGYAATGGSHVSERHTPLRRHNIKAVVQRRVPQLRLHTRAPSIR
jgi:hypothetical protein